MANAFTPKCEFFTKRNVLAIDQPAYIIVSMIDVNRQIHEYGHHLLGFIQARYIDALITLLVYVILAKAADLIIDKAFKRIAGLTNMSFDDELIKFLHKPICISIFLMGPLHVSIEMGFSPPWDFIISNTTKTLILAAWWFPLMAFVSKKEIKEPTTITEKAKIGREVFLLFRNFIRVSAIAIGIIAVLLIWNVSLTPLFASAGIAGIAVAMAARDTLANFFGGISIFMDKSYKVGDYIILDSGERGEVVDIGIRSTRIMTRDDVLITIPNSIMSNAKIINESAPVPRFRIRVPVGVAYGSNLKKVEDLLVDISLRNPDVVRDPKPRARIRGFGDSSIDFELLCWVNDPRFKGRVIHQLLQQIYSRFEEESISIPFPQRDVHLRVDSADHGADHPDLPAG